MIIHKYRVDVTDTSVVPMPRGAKILHFGEQGGHLCLWALVNPKNAQQDYKFLIRGTGNPLTGKEGGHLATVQMGHFVWHIFEG